MSTEHEEVQKLLRLKRYERPPEGYYDQFLTQFQSRQRAELLKRSAHSLFFERLATYFSGFSTPRLVGAAAGACAAVVLTVIMISNFPGEDEGTKTAQNPEIVPGKSLMTNLPKPELEPHNIPAELSYPNPLSGSFASDFEGRNIGIFVSDDLYRGHLRGPVYDLFDF